MPEIGKKFFFFSGGVPFVIIALQQKIRILISSFHNKVFPILIAINGSETGPLEYIGATGSDGLGQVR